MDTAQNWDLQRTITQMDVDRKDSEKKQKKITMKIFAKSLNVEAEKQVIDEITWKVKPFRGW